VFCSVPATSSLYSNDTSLFHTDSHPVLVAAHFSVCHTSTCIHSSHLPDILKFTTHCRIIENIMFFSVFFEKIYNTETLQNFSFNHAYFFLEIAEVIMQRIFCTGKCCVHADASSNTYISSSPNCN